MSKRTTLYALNVQLQGQGWAMLTLGGSQGQTLAGAISTGTHGSDLEQPPLPGVVLAVHLVTTGGQEVWIESASEPLTADDNALRLELGPADVRIIRDDAALRAAKVTVGRFGIIYAYVIKVTRSYRLSEHTQDLKWSAVSRALVAGVGLGNDVPVRSHLGDLPALLATPPASLEIITEVNDFRFLDILINMNMRKLNGDKTCWVRRRWLTYNTQEMHLDVCNPLCHFGAPRVLLTHVAAALKVYSGVVAPLNPVKAAQILADSVDLNVSAHNTGTTGGMALAQCLNAVWRAQTFDELEWLIAEVNHMFLGVGLGESTGEGRRGPGWKVMAGTTEDAVGNCYRSNAIELTFSTETSAYIDFVNRLLEDIKDFHTGGYISVRFSSRSDASLSMHNVRTPLGASVEVVSLHGLEDNGGWIAHVEKIGKAAGGRPHWGQQNQLSIEDVSALYDPAEVQSWREQCLSVVGVSGTFSNKYTRQRGLEPVAPNFGPWASVSGGLITRPGAPVTVVTWGTRFALFATDANGVVFTAGGDPQNGLMDVWAPLSANFVSVPGAPITVVPWGTRFALFATNSDGVVCTAGGDPNGLMDAWAPVSANFVSVPGAPVTVVPWGSRFALFATNSDGVVCTAGGDPNGLMDAWAPLSDAFVSVPGAPVAAVPWNGRFALFATNSDGVVCTAGGDPNGLMGPWAPVSANFVGVPGAPVTAVPWGPRFALFAANSAGVVCTAAGDPQNDLMGPWASASDGATMPGSFIRAVAYGQRFALFVADPGGGIFAIAGDPQGFGLWESVSEGRSTPGAPVTAVPWGNRFALFIADPNGGIFTAAGTPR